MNEIVAFAVETLTDVRTATALALLLAGCVLLVLGAIGQARMLDFYTRLHALAPTYSLGGALILAALAVDVWDLRFTLRILALGALIAVFAPMLTALLANAAHASGLAPRVGKLDPDGR